MEASLVRPLRRREALAPMGGHWNLLLTVPHAFRRDSTPHQDRVRRIFYLIFLRQSECYRESSQFRRTILFSAPAYSPLATKFQKMEYCWIVLGADCGNQLLP